MASASTVGPPSAPRAARPAGSGCRPSSGGGDVRRSRPPRNGRCSPSLARTGRSARPGPRPGLPASPAARRSWLERLRPGPALPSPRLERPPLGPPPRSRTPERPPPGPRRPSPRLGRSARSPPRSSSRPSAERFRATSPATFFQPPVARSLPGFSAGGRLAGRRASSPRPRRSSSVTDLSLVGRCRLLASPETRLGGRVVATPQTESMSGGTYSPTQSPAQYHRRRKA